MNCPVVIVPQRGADGEWNAGRLTQTEAGLMPGLCECRFRRAPVDEVMALTTHYETRHRGWNVQHFHSGYQRAGGTHSYT